MKILNIYPFPCEYAYPAYNKEGDDPDIFDKEVMCYTDLEVRYLKGLTELGAECVLFYPRKNNVSIKEFRHHNGYRIKRFPISFSLGSVDYPLKMLWHIRKEKPDLVQYHGIYGGGKYFYLRFYCVVMLFCWLFRIPFFGWYHTGSFTPIPSIKNLTDKYRIFKSIDNFLRTWPFNLTKGITSINHIEIERLFNPNYTEYYGHKLKTKHYKVTHNTINPKIFRPVEKEKALAFTGLNKDNTYILFLSRIIESKGLHDIIEVLPQIIDHHKNIALLIVGDSLDDKTKYKKQIFTRIQELNLSSYINFIGRIEHHQGIEYYYNVAEVFVLPTYTESFGAVNIEAMACGIPIISSNIEEIPFYTKPGMGILIEPGNREQLKEAMLKILDKEFIFNKEFCLDQMKKFGYLQAAKELFTWYKNILNIS